MGWRWFFRTICRTSQAVLGGKNNVPFRLIIYLKPKPMTILYIYVVYYIYICIHYIYICIHYIYTYVYIIYIYVYIIYIYMYTLYIYVYIIYIYMYTLYILLNIYIYIYINNVYIHEIPIQSQLLMLTFPLNSSFSMLKSSTFFESISLILAASTIIFRW